MLIIFFGCEFEMSTAPDFTNGRNILQYDDLRITESMIREYKDAGMPWFYPCYVWPERDPKNVPLVEYPAGIFYNPVTIAETAFAYNSEFLREGNKDFQQAFLNNADWLVNNHDDTFYYRYNFPFTHSGGDEMPAGWVSGMAQGMALAVVSMAFNMTGDSTYLKTAENIFKTFVTYSNDSWTFYVDRDGHYWIEEYPNPDHCHVLNGKLFAMWGIWNYYVVSCSDRALLILKACIRSVADKYSLWKVPGQTMSYYCLHGCITEIYHPIHLQQLQHFADFFDLPEFRQAVDCYSGKIICDQ